MPNNALPNPEKSPSHPSRWTILFAASKFDEWALLDSTCALVDNVMSGYVRVIDRRPPPAPARACATLSDGGGMAEEGVEAVSPSVGVGALTCAMVDDVGRNKVRNVLYTWNQDL